MLTDLKGTIVKSPTVSGDGHKLHHRIVGGQEIVYQCEGENCQYCKQEAEQKTT